LKISTEKPCQYLFYKNGFDNSENWSLDTHGVLFNKSRPFKSVHRVFALNPDEFLQVPLIK
jgi:hypothetical protein